MQVGRPPKNGFESGAEDCNTRLSLRCRISRRPVNAGNPSSHRTDVGAQLSTVMNGVKQSDPKQSSDCVLDENFLFSLHQPSRTIPGSVVEMKQFLDKLSMVQLESG